MACTTILVGKNASYDGSTMVARNEDSPAGEFTPKEFIVVKPEDHPIKYKSIISKVEISLPENPMRYTLMPDAKRDKGIWGGCGVNEKNVSMTATETITSNERVLSADPLVEGGIGEEDMVSLVLPYMTSARDGAKRLGKLLEEYGTYEMNGIAFQDEDEIWWLETIGGHHWIAARLPDDCYAVIPNQLGIDYFDLEDALGEQKEFMCSSDLKSFIDDNFLDLSIDEEYLNTRYAFGSYSDSDHTYNTPRAWVLQRFFNPNTNIWDGIDADFRPDSDDIPWCRLPEKKITVEDVKRALSNHFQGTPYDPYAKHGDLSYKGSFRPIGVNRTNFLAMVQIRPYVPEAIKCVEWVAFGSNVFNAFVPFYVNINDTPDYMKTGDKVSTDEFYWTNRLIGALSNASFAACAGFVERYQMKLQSEGHAIIKKYDAKIKAQKMAYEAATKVCEEANREIAEIAKKETDQLLADVLYQASCEMKNGFARSDA
ncbi:MAG: C69 family dipeptidase [Bacillota bacterium]|nr:C69 family dipeptidase [Bacillota bacterium]